MKFTREQLVQAGFREYEKGVWSPAVPGRDPAKVPNVEPSPGRQPQGQDAPEGGDQREILLRHPVRIRVTAYRAGMRDPDNICAKWMIDSLVSCDVIEDDSLEFVHEVTLRLRRCRQAEERTVLEVYPA